MWLTGNKIREEVLRSNIKITPFHDANINPNSYNYTLFPVIKRIKNKIIDINSIDSYEEITITKKGYKLIPGECYLGSTNEVFCTNKYASLVTGRSSIGRKFITNHVTAGLIDQGFNGRITLEITVVKPTIIYPYIPFGQIFWFKTVGDPLLYTGRYQNQVNPEISKVSQNLVESIKKKKIYLINSDHKGKFNFEDNFYLDKNQKFDNKLRYNKKFINLFLKEIKNKQVDRVELTGGLDPLENKDILKIISFLKRSNLKIKLYTKANRKIKITKIDEINIVFLFDKKNKIKTLIESAVYYKKFCKKIRVSIPITKKINSITKIKKMVAELSLYFDEIILRPLTKDFSKYKKYSPKKIRVISLPKVKYDKIENIEDSGHILLLPKDFN